MNTGVFLLGIIAVLIYIIAHIVGMLRNGVRSMRFILFGFAMTCALLTFSYWAIFDLMYEDKALPFAANELGEWALFLLLGAILLNGVPKKRVPLVTEMTAMAVFVAVNTALWIYWNGEWVQDIATGLSLGYFLYGLLRQMKYSGKFSRTEWILLAVSAFAAVGFQLTAVFTGGSAGNISEKAGYAFMIAVMAVIFVLSAKQLMTEQGSVKGVCLSFSFLAWCTFSMYMSDGVWYLILMVGSYVAIVLMFIAMRKEVRAA